jgi:multisubunit Na+/H+ antiporter MnhB subunit
MSESKPNLVAGIVIAGLIFTALMVVLVSEPFPGSTMSHSEMIPTQPGGEIGGAMSRFLWDFRGLDLTFQTLVLFTTAICCLALLREEMKH